MNTHAMTTCDEPVNLFEDDDVCRPRSKVNRGAVANGPDLEVRLVSNEIHVVRSEHRPTVSVIYLACGAVVCHYMTGKTVVQGKYLEDNEDAHQRLMTVLPLGTIWQVH